jgi:GNAT superfamily N-acetyltransferase
LRLRPASIDDVNAVAALFSDLRRLLAFLPELHSREEDREFIRFAVLATMHVTVAEDAAGIAGFIAETDGWVEHIYLAPARRRVGIGSSLLDAAKLRQPTLELWCFAENLEARAFYERHGFVSVERTDGIRNEARHSDIRYSWRRPALATPWDMSS